MKLDSADKSDTVSFAKNAVSKEFGENRADPCGRLRRRFAIYPPEQALSAHLKQLVKKVGEDKAMEMLKGAPLSYGNNCQGPIACDFAHPFSALPCIFSSLTPFCR